MSSRIGGVRGTEGGNLHSITALWDAPMLDKTWWIALLDALQVNKIRLSTLQGAFPADKMWWSALYSTLANKHLMSYSEDGFHHCRSYHANVQYVQQVILEFNTAAVQHRRHQHKLAALPAWIFQLPFCTVGGSGSFFIHGHGQDTEWHNFAHTNQRNHSKDELRQIIDGWTVEKK